VLFVLWLWSSCQISSLKGSFSSMLKSPCDGPYNCCRGHQFCHLWAWWQEVAALLQGELGPEFIGRSSAPSDMGEGPRTH
jgi:hypothetical protein